MENNLGKTFFQFLFFFWIINTANLSSQVPSISSKQDKSLKTYNNTNTSFQVQKRWEIIENPTAYPIINLIKTINGDVYANSLHSILYFNKNEWIKIYSTDYFINSFDTDGDFIVITFGTPANGLLKFSILIGKISKFKNGIRVRNLQDLNSPISNHISAVKFLRNKEFFLGSILEYEIIKIISCYNNNFIFEREHVALDSVRGLAGILIGKTSSNNIFPFSDQHALYYADFTKEKFKLNEIFNLYNVFKEATLISEIRDIFKVSVLDSNFGVCFTSKNIFIFNRVGKNLDLKCLESIKASWQGANILSKRPIEIIPEHISSCMVLNKNEIWLTTDNGSLLFGDGDTWKIIETFDNIGKSDIVLINPKQIMISGNYSVKFERDALYKKNLPGLFDEKKNKIFIFEPFETSKAGYGIGIIRNGTSIFEDVFIASIYGKNNLYLESEKTRFFYFDHSTERGVAEKKYDNIEYPAVLNKLGVAVGDINEDGSDDLIVTYLDGSNALFINNGNGYFKNFTEEAGLNVPMWRSECAILADINNDGWLDIFMTSSIKSNRLFLNLGGGKFKDITESAGLKSAGKSVCAAFGDVNSDGFPDLYIGNWMDSNRLYINNRDGTFTDYTNESRAGCGKFKKTNSVMFADFNNDGYLDLFVGNRDGGNELFLGNGKGGFKNVSKESGIRTAQKIPDISPLSSSANSIFDNDISSSYPKTYGSVFGDFNNDGNLDILIAYLGGVKIYQNIGIDNEGTPKFKDASKDLIMESGNLNGYNTGASTFDLLNDGDIDIVIGQLDGWSFLLNNKLNDGLHKSKNFISVRIIGSKSNRDGIGAKLKLYRNEKMIAFREVMSGYGYASSSSKVQHFGLPDTTSKYLIEVEFPASGIVKNEIVKPGCYVTMQEMEGYANFKELTVKWFDRVIKSNDLYLTLLKFFIFIFISFIILTILEWRRRRQDYDAKDYKIKFIPFSKQTLLISILIYIVSTIVIEYGQELFYGDQIWIAEKRNILLQDIVPLTFSMSLVFLYIKIFKPSNVTGTVYYEIMEKLFTKLKNFKHGEGSYMNLERLLLLVSNIKTEKSPLTAGTNSGNPVFSRLQIAFKEFIDIVSPDLLEIRSLSKLLEMNEEKVIKKGSAKNDFVNILPVLCSKVEEGTEKFISQIKSMEFSDSGNLRQEIIIGINQIKTGIMDLYRLIEVNFIIDICKTISSIVDKFKSGFGKDGLILNHYEQEYPVFGIMKSNEFGNIISIMIENSIDAMADSDRKQIEINCEVNDSIISINIIDSGPGIKTEDREKVFENGYSTKIGKRGFGLAYARKTLERFGGKLYYLPDSKVGSHFVIEMKRSM